MPIASKVTIKRFAGLRATLLGARGAGRYLRLGDVE